MANIFDYSERQIHKAMPMQKKVLALDSTYATMSDEELQGCTAKFKDELANGKTLDDILPDAFAAIREASWRVLDMKPYPVQVLGGIILHQGNIAELKTGEGKTLVATMPAYLNALTGKGVHVVTVNDYLAKRDAEWMGKVYNFMGLSVGVILNDMDGDERKQAYDADITYGTNNEFGFDYLRDNMVQDASEKVQRELNFAIIDEVDSILIDEARTPLIISGPGTESTELYRLADIFVKDLKMAKVKETESKEAMEYSTIPGMTAKNPAKSHHDIVNALRYSADDALDTSKHNLESHPSQTLYVYAALSEDHSLSSEEKEKALTELLTDAFGIPDDSHHYHYETAEILPEKSKITGGKEKQQIHVKLHYNAKQAKEEQEAKYEAADYIVDEKNKTATLTRNGIKKAEAFFHLDNLSDAENTTLFHHINQAIRAHGVMHKDIDYVVKNQEVLIVDEFTGRIMNGRRYNEGLHQAIEAKEHVPVQKESKTLASITFQNFFRIYHKLSGMTGTAMTEADEFAEIYNLYPVVIPTNKPVIRKDYQDIVYPTENGKFHAVIEQIKQCHAKSQPVLVGTVSIEKSEKLSRMLTEAGLSHEVLNAKNNEREAEIIAQAGTPGAITISTNMAGRGTDIMLGGNPEFLAKAQLHKDHYPNEAIREALGYADSDNQLVLEIREKYAQYLEEYKKKLAPEKEKAIQAGGLFIIGTERHEARRIDNQLRGRSGRQGDPGESRFYLSMQDKLIRIFGGERMDRLMAQLNIPEDEPIETKSMTKSIARAQKRLEDQNYAIRKQVLQYDDVMDQQRKIIYRQRNAILDKQNIHQDILDMMDLLIDETVVEYCPKDKKKWDLDGLRFAFSEWLTVMDEPLEAFLKRSEIQTYLKMKAHKIYGMREAELTPEVTHDLERLILLKNVDELWMDHIDVMDELKQGISLRAYGQQDPVTAYKLVGTRIFNEMNHQIRANTIQDLMLVQVQFSNEESSYEDIIPEQETNSVIG